MFVNVTVNSNTLPALAVVSLPSGHVGLTDFRDHSRMLDDKSLLGQDIANFSMDKCGNIDESFGRSSLLDPGDGRPSGVSVVETLERNNVYWCYDTPGVINDRQVRGCFDGRCLHVSDV